MEKSVFEKAFTKAVKEVAKNWRELTPKEQKAMEASFAGETEPAFSGSEIPLDAIPPENEELKEVISNES